jgi:S-adenosyl-L-methionine hydrolase (adenosine-forming)
MSDPVITLLTDFGTEDYFVGAMKGVILTRSPKSILVDITHAIPPQDVLTGAFTLSAACAFFPPGSIHLAVVDPGVGSDRRPILVEAAAYFFVGPDNGLFSVILDRVPTGRVRHLTNRAFFLPNLSSTFHGRDIFAPVAAALAEGVSPQTLGPTIQDPVRLEMMKCERNPDGSLSGAIIHIDHFGNCITNIPSEQLPPSALQSLCLKISDFEIRKAANTYSELVEKPGTPFLIPGSAGFLEISVQNSSAARELKIKLGDRVQLAWKSVGRGMIGP